MGWASAAPGEPSKFALAFDSEAVDADYLVGSGDEREPDEGSDAAAEQDLREDAEVADILADFQPEPVEG